MGYDVEGMEGQALSAEVERALLAELLPERGRMLEIGTYHGVTAAEIADARPGARVVCVDPFKDGPRTLTGDKAIWTKNARVNMELYVGTAQDYVREWSPDLYLGFDLAFVDGAHDYEHCLADLRSAALMINEGGLIAAHDYKRKPENTEIERAVEQFCSESSWEIVRVVWKTVVLRRAP